MEKIKTVSEMICEISPYYKKRVEKQKAGLINSVPETEHKLVYDSSSETLEPVYFFILDLMNDFGLNPEKFLDSFSSSVGSGHFAELGQRASIMQQQGSKLLGDINTVLRSIINIIYDLKEFRIFLQPYKDLEIPNKKSPAILSLKQRWMDKVDITKGNSSIKAMALGQAGFATLIDAFLVAKDEKDVTKIDLNERVKRILIARIHEFNSWIVHSGEELKKRYEIEKVYLKSQVNSLKLYSNWAKPYLKAAQKLEVTEGGRNPALVKTFNTIILELTLLGKSKLNVKNSALAGELPKEFAKEKFLKNLKRNYHSCVLVDFEFRGIPQKVAQQSHFTFGGRAEVTFKAYSLNDEELKKLNQKFEDSGVEDALKLVEGATTESLDQLKKEIDFFLEEQPKEEKQKQSSGVNPFLALVGKYENKSEKEETKKETDKEIIVQKDNFVEGYFRKLAGEKAKEIAFNLFDVYKKAHRMASFT